ncbi:flavodoxin [Cellulomonas soli]|uniref:flavodoxin n=1 Tax=Cellulomonas soli TaxID=931535 RepID=UPI003F84EF43
MSRLRLDRRTFLRASLLLGTGAVAAACTAARTDGPDATLSARTPAADHPETTPVPSSAPTPGSTILLAYFSRAGENYWYGGRRDLEVGNTEVLATLIADRLGCDVYRIEAADPYPHDYRETVDRNVREQDEDARPVIAGALPDVSGYGTVILASPIWNVRPPMIMSTFVEALPLRGATLLPVTTHAMSGLGRAVEVYSALAPDAIVGEGLAVRGEEVAEAGIDLDDYLARTLLR